MDVKPITIAAHDATAPRSRSDAAAPVRAERLADSAHLGAKAGASGWPGHATSEGGVKPYRPPTPDTPAGPPPSFAITPLELHSALQTTLARLDSAGYATARRLGIASTAPLTASTISPAPAFEPRPPVPSGDPPAGGVPEKGAPAQKAGTEGPRPEPRTPPLNLLLSN